jgi:SAM-dependent methyltransferase
VIETWSHGPADENMPQAMLVETLARVRRHPWWLAPARLALALLRQGGVVPSAPVLDVGCGWGVNLTALEAAGYATTGLDISPQILAMIDQPGRHLIEADLNQPPPADRELYSGLLLLDVIEHLDDDCGTIRRLAPLAQPGALLVVSVPALPELFSEYDAIQGHRRRYLPATLRAAFDDTGFVVEKIFWWGAWMVPILRRMRRKNAGANSASAPKTYADYLRLPPWPMPLVMRLAYVFEQRLAINGRLKTGTSLFALAARKDQP